MLDDRLRARLRREMERVDELLRRYESLIAEPQESAPDLIEVTALASVLHSFYTGVESMFAAIVKRVDGASPQGRYWHKDLLAQMAAAAERRPAVISAETREKLEAYLGFRHYYRHGYSFLLEWEEMKGLVSALEDTWMRIRLDVERFLEAAS